MVTITPTQDRLFLGQAVYTSSVLSKYDKIVGLSARFLWKCSWPKLLNLYNQNISSNHLEVGVGSGYFLDRCRFQVKNPRIALLDLNPNSLEFSAKRIERYKPSTHIGNVLEAISLESEQFDSIGFNYVLHCIPGILNTKADTSFKNLKPLLKSGGVLFGSTILGEGVKHNYFGDLLMEIYNNTGVFNNCHDRVADLTEALDSNFSSYSVKIIGCTALFTARK